jgi:hypothetical protein
MNTLDDSIPLDTDYSNLESFRIRKPILVRYLILSCIGFLGMFAFITIGFLRWRFAMNHFGPAAVWRWITPPLWGVIGLGLFGLVSLILRFRTSQLEIQLTPMAITYRKGRNLKVYRWDEVNRMYITSIRYGILKLSWSRKTEALLHFHNGQRLKINQAFERIETLMDSVKRYVYPIMFSRYRNAFNRGESIPFGPLVLTPQGIMNGRKIVRWQELTKIDLQGGFLQLQSTQNSRGKKYTIPVHRIPNIDLCIQLLQHFGPQT